MICPKCQQPTKIVDSRLKGARKWRRHLCPNDHKFTTWEAPISELELSDDELNRLVVKAVANILPTMIDQIVAGISSGLRRE